MKSNGAASKTRSAKRKADPETRIRRVIEKWFITEPLLFGTILTHRLGPNLHTETIRTGHGRLEYHPQFIELLDDETLEEVLKLETIRIVLGHPYARRLPSGETSYLASNITLKEHLRTSLPLPSAAEVFGDDSLSKQYYELYCDRLAEKSSPLSSPTALPSSPEGPTDSSHGGSSAEESSAPMENARAKGGAVPTVADHFDSRGGSERTQMWQEDSLMREQINNVIREVELSQSWGALPGSLVAMIRAMLKPRLDYRKILRSFGTSILASRRELTRFKPSRRYGFDYMGSRYALRTKLLVAVDVSGSISDGDLEHAYSVINRLFQYGIETIDTLQFDTELKGPVDTFARKRFQVDVLGRGGTNFGPVLEYIDVHRDYDGLIIITDGIAPKPSKPKNRKTRVLWLFTSESTYEQSAKVLEPIGRAVFIRPASAAGTYRKGSARS